MPIAIIALVRLGSEKGRERDRKDQERAGEQRIGDPRDQHVRHAARVARQQTDRHADRDRDQHRHDAGEQRGARAEHDARQHVAADLVGAEPVRDAGCLAHGRETGRDWIVGRDHARAERHDDEPRDHGEPDRCGRAPQQAAQDCRARHRRAPSAQARPPTRRRQRGREHHCTRIRGLTIAYATSATRFRTMYAVAVNSTTPCTTA